LRLLIVTLFSAARVRPRPARLPYTTLFRSSPRTECLPEAPSWLRNAGVRTAVGVLPLLAVVGVLFAVASASWDVRTDRLRERRRSEEHTSELQSRENLVCRLLLVKKNLRTE